MRIKVGADPEFFLKKDGKNVSAHDIVPGNKRKPHPLSVGAVQADGTAVEFNIAPAICSGDFATNIQRTLDDVRSLVPADLEFDISPSIVYPEAYFKELPNFSKELGCDPDYNAYTEQVNPRPEGNKTTMRTGAGHMHFGWTENTNPLSKSHMWDCRQVTKACDSVFASVQKLWDKDEQRRKLYGAIGAFRPKPYGCEYRVLSNAWLKYPKLWPWLFDTAQFIFNRLEEGNYYHIYNEWSCPYPHDIKTVNSWLNYYVGQDCPKIPLDWCEERANG